jgi:hypothetical protein
LGFSDARLLELGSWREFTEQFEYDRLMAALRERLGQAEVERLMAEGGAWTEDAAVAEAFLM